MLDALALLWTVQGQPSSPACGRHDVVVARLAEVFGEAVQSVGMTSDGMIAEIFFSDETGTWTILVTRPDNISCMLASGTLWEPNIKPLDPPGDDT